MESNKQAERTGEIAVLEQEILDSKKRLADLKRRLPVEEIPDYALAGPDGSQTKLSELFGGHMELIVIHNMGKSCAYCTLWADGFNGVLHHLEDRAGFVVVSPDDPAVQKEFAAGRGWKFTMLSGTGNSFTEDMGFVNNKGGYIPGVSTFRRDNDGRIYRKGRDIFGPGDYYCGAWHLFDLLPEGTNEWEPKFSYQENA